MRMVIKKFIFGFEESYGYLAGTFVKDKDAVLASMLIAEMAAIINPEICHYTKDFWKFLDKYGHTLEVLSISL